MEKRIGIIIPIIDTKYIYKLKKILEKTIRRQDVVFCIVNDGNHKISESLKQIKNSKIFDYLNLDNNVGFAEANNSGWDYLLKKHPNIRYLGSLNDDTCPRDGWLDSLESILMSNEKVALVGPRAEECIKRYRIFLIKQLINNWQINEIGQIMKGKNSRDRDNYVPVVSGFCFLAKKDAILSVGMFDVRYRNGGEDLDLCLKLREKKYSLMISNKALVRHYVGQSRFQAKTITDLTFNRKLIKDKWGCDLTKYNYV